MLPDGIILNGTSGSGKSSIARELQRLLPEPFLHVQVDAFTDMLDLSHPKVTDRPWETPYLWNLLRGYVDCLRTLMEAENRLIIDAILAGGPGAEVEEYAEALEGFAVALVGVRCAQATAEARQRARGADPDLPSHQVSVHDHDVYDLEVHTDDQRSEDCAAQIARWLSSDGRPQALERLRERAEGS